MRLFAFISLTRSTVTLAGQNVASAVRPVLSLRCTHKPNANLPEALLDAVLQVTATCDLYHVCDHLRVVNSARRASKRLYVVKIDELSSIDLVTSTDGTVGTPVEHSISLCNHEIATCNYFVSLGSRLAIT